MRFEMPLQGDAKREYQREYMRRKRLGLPTRTNPAKEEEIAPSCSFCGEEATASNVLAVTPQESPIEAYICRACAENAFYAIAERRR
jgi:hypothetical protein